MQRFEKCDECSRLRRTQIFSIGRHVAASLNYLPDELILRLPHCDSIQGRASLPAAASKGMAIAALFGLKNERSLALQCRSVQEHSLGHWITAPGVHMRTPGRELSQTRK